MVTRPTERHSVVRAGSASKNMKEEYFVYILEDDKGKKYKGMTNNLQRRLGEHERGKTKTTRGMKNLRVVHTERYSNLMEARKREIYFKTAAGRQFIKKILGM